MPHPHSIPLAVCICLATISGRTSAEKSSPSIVDLRDDKDNVLVAADHIASYDWTTHTLALAPGERAKLAAGLRKTGKLVSGIPFAICLGGKPVYAGKLTTSASSFSFSTPVIIVDGNALNPNLGEDKLQIIAGYPTREFFRGEDPRNDTRLQAALRAAGKLVSAPSGHTEWLSAALREMQTIKPGMTRADLLRVFTEEGGLSTRTQRRYAYRDCPYIKVNVRFEPVGSPDDKHINAAADKILEISQPFLEWTIAD